MCQVYVFISMEKEGMDLQSATASCYIFFRSYQFKFRCRLACVYADAKGLRHYFFIVFI